MPAHPRRRLPAPRRPRRARPRHRRAPRRRRPRPPTPARAATAAACAWRRRPRPRPRRRPCLGARSMTMRTSSAYLAPNASRSAATGHASVLTERNAKAGGCAATAAARRAPLCFRFAPVRDQRTDDGCSPTRQGWGGRAGEFELRAPRTLCHVGFNLTLAVPQRQGGSGRTAEVDLHARLVHRVARTAVGAAAAGAAGARARLGLRERPVCQVAVVWHLRA